MAQREKCWRQRDLARRRQCLVVLAHQGRRDSTSVDELHAAIAAYLRAHNPRAIKACALPVPLASVRCRACGRPILDAGAGDVAALGALLTARRCVGCFLREGA